MRKSLRKMMAIMLSFLFIITAFASIPFTASAVVEHVEVQMIAFPRGGGDSRWGRPDLTLMNGWTTNATTMFQAIGAVNRNMQAAFCVQPGVPINNGDINPEISSVNFLRDYDNGVLGYDDIVALLGRIFQYGYNGRITTDMTYDQITNHIATQLHVWSVITGERDWDFSYIAPPSHLNRMWEYIRPDHPQRALIQYHYNRIETAVINHSRIPSFMSRAAFLAPTHEMAWDGTGFSVTLTDTNNVAGSFNFTTTTPGVTFEVSGNQLTIRAATPPTTPIDIRANRTNLQRSSVVFWAAHPINVTNQPQALTTVGQEITDPVPAFLRVETSTGNLDIIKTTEHNNGAVAGFQFRVENVTTGQDLGVFTSGADGRIHIPNLQVGRHRVTEINIPADFVLPTPNPVYIEVLPGQTSAVSFNNIRKRGQINVTKLDESTGDRPQGDATLNGAIFDVFAADDIRHNDGTLIYARDTLVDTLHTGDTNTATSRILPLGRYAVVERTEPHGYTHSSVRHYVTIRYANENAPVVTESINVYNRVVEGRISVVKFTDPAGDNNQIMQPLEGAIFEIYLTSAGSFDNALPTERARITTDIYGRATTPLLPYGRYTVREVYAPGDVRLVEPFEVYIDENSDGRTFNFILNNPTFTSRLRVVKADATTGNTIPVAGTAFRIWCVRNDDWVRQTIYYPTPRTIEIFYTADCGSLILPNPLSSGRFELHEYRAPYGYLLGEPVPFEIHSSLVDPNNPTVIEITMYNEPVMGKISIYKQGEMLIGAENTDTDFGVSYSPIFSMRRLKGVVFHVYARTDIVTPDGTVRYRQGELVDVITTAGRGKATTRPLFLGEYEVIEQQAKYSFFRDPTIHRVTLSYADQYTPIVTEQLRLENQRQRVEISLQKHLERTDNWTDNSAYENVRFGIFARYDIYCARGRKQGDIEELEPCDSYDCEDEYCGENTDNERIQPIIPAGALIEVFGVDENGRGIVQTCLPHGSFFIRELTTGGSAWLIDDRDFDIAFDYDCQDVAVVQIHVGGIDEDGNPYVIVNRLARGEVRVLKLCSATGQTLQGVIFGLFRDGVLLYETATCENGIAVFGGIHFGEVEIRELYGLEGFIVTDEVFLANISADGEVIEITVYNEPVPVPEVPEVPSAPDNPQTGDRGTIARIAQTAIALSIVALLIILKVRRKKTQSSNIDDE